MAAAAIMTAGNRGARGCAVLALLSLLICVWTAASNVQAEDLSPAEINTIITEVKLEEPAILQGKPVSDLAKALDQVSPEALLEAAADFGLVNKTADAIVTPELAAEVVLAGLTAPQGTAGSEAPPPTDIAAASPLDAPEDCPGWACVCEGQAAGARVAAPNNAECSAFITCTGNGDGSKSLCAVAGTGFNPSTQLCEALAAPSEGGQLCVFDQGAVQALQFGPAADSTAVVAADAAAASSNTVTLTCDALMTSSKANRNIEAVTGDGLLLTSELGNSFCTLAKPNKPGRIQLSAGTANTSITAVVLRFLEQGTGATITVSAGGKGPRTVLNRPASPPTPASEAAPGTWLPKAAAHSFPALAGRITIELSPFPTGGSLRLVSVTLTTAPTPAKPAKQDALLSAKQVQELQAIANATASSAKALEGLSSNDLYTGATGQLPPRRGSGGGGVSVQRMRAWKISMRVGDIAEIVASRTQEIVSNILAAYKNSVTKGASACYRESYNRGAGTIPNDCSGWSNEGGICYAPCDWNYNAASFVCWQKCDTVWPHNWQDHGVTCHLPMHSYWNSNNGCGWWDICGTWDRTWCRSCDAGYRRDGCVCTRDPRWHTKHTYTRSSKLPSCGGGTHNQNGLCYQPCAQGYWGEAFMCYNHCPDIMPHSCGIGVCTKDATACREFVAGAIGSMFSLVISLAGATTGVGVASALATAGQTALYFMNTKVCSNYHVDPSTNMAFVQVPDRDFKGTDVAFHNVGKAFDACLMHCKNNPSCQFVVYAPDWAGGMCVLRRDIAVPSAPHGDNIYKPGLRSAVAIGRLNQDQADWQWARSAGADSGAIIRVQSGENNYVDSIPHAEKGQNTIVCQLLCLQQNDCTHVVHNTERCWLMNRRGSPSVTVPQATNTIVNMATWNDFDRV